MRICLLTLVLSAVTTLGFAATKPQSIEDRSTHRQSSVISIADVKNPLKINAFCLDAQGNIVAVCGSGPGEVRVVNDQGEIVRSWDLDVRPEAVNVASDGSILVGGIGKLFRFDSQGNEVKSIASPHVEHLRSDNPKLREQAISYIKRRSGTFTASSLEDRVNRYEAIIEQLQKRGETGELNEAEERMLKLLPNTLKYYKQKLEIAQKKEEGQKNGEDGPSEEEIKSQIESMIASKMRISAISSSKDYVFVTTRAIEGYGFDVWRTDKNFNNSEVIIKGLSGCCGQMDVQCCEQGIFVAENSRDRVVHYDVNGKEISHWGKSDRTGIDGFGSCCNPMNVCFDKKGYIYTAEASLGRIKQFDSKGKLISYIGDVDLVPGCKNVSIAVSPVNNNIYMLDLTRNHIKVMQPKPVQKTEAEDVEGDDSNKTAAAE